MAFLWLIVALALASFCVPCEALKLGTQAGRSDGRGRPSIAVPWGDPFRYAYSYLNHGQDWVQGSCASRERQSPVNFDDMSFPVSDHRGFYYNYQVIEKPIKIVNDGLLLLADFVNRGDGGITFQNAWYNLASIEVHAISEHTFLSNHTPLELHIVHERDESEYDGPPYVILAIPIVSPKHGLAEAKTVIVEPPTTTTTTTTTTTAKKAEKKSKSKGKKSKGFLQLGDEPLEDEDDDDTSAVLADADDEEGDEDDAVAVDDDGEDEDEIDDGSAVHVDDDEDDDDDDDDDDELSEDDDDAVQAGTIPQAVQGAVHFMNVGKKKKYTGKDKDGNCKKGKKGKKCRKRLKKAEAEVAAEEAKKAAAPTTPPPYAAPNVSETGFNPILSHLFLNEEPPAPGKTRETSTTHMNKLDLNPLPKDGQYFKYMGSQTRPPCDEKVQWFLRRNFIEASDTQVEYLYSAIFGSSPQVGNWRSVFPLQNRPIAMIECAQGEPVLYADNYTSIPGVGPNPFTEREHRANVWVKDALNYANDAQNSMRDLDQRLHAAAENHVQKVQNFPTLERLRAMASNDSPWGPKYGTPPPMSQGMSNAINDNQVLYNQKAKEFLHAQVPLAVQPGVEEANDQMKEMIEAAREAALSNMAAPSPASAPAIAVSDGEILDAAPAGAPAAAPGGFNANWVEPFVPALAKNLPKWHDKVPDDGDFHDVKDYLSQT